MELIYSQLTSLTTSVEAIGPAGDAVEYDLPTLCGMTGAQWAAMAKQSVIIGVLVDPANGTKTCMFKCFATTQAASLATSLDQTTAARTGVAVSDFAPAFFYGDPTLPFLLLYSVAGCDAQVFRVQ